MEVLSQNGGVPLVRFEVCPDDIVASVEGLDPRDESIDFGDIVGKPVLAVHGVLVGSFGSTVAMLNERVELGFREMILEFKRGEEDPALVRVIEIPRWAEHGAVEGVTVYLGLITDSD